MGRASRCSAGAKIVIYIHRRNRIHRWTKFAYVDASLTENVLLIPGAFFAAGYLLLLSAVV